VTGAERRARRSVDIAHHLALNYPDPVAYLRRRQAEAEADYAATGHSEDLALVRAFEESLDGMERPEEASWDA
jgi:hypothetical protein